MVTSVPGVAAPTRLAAAIRGAARITAICAGCILRPSTAGALALTLGVVQAELDGHNPAAR